MDQRMNSKVATAMIDASRASVRTPEYKVMRDLLIASSVSGDKRLIPDMASVYVAWSISVQRELEKVIDLARYPRNERNKLGFAYLMQSAVMFAARRMAEEFPEIDNAEVIHQSLLAIESAFDDLGERIAMEGTFEQAMVINIMPIIGILIEEARNNGNRARSTQQPNAPTTEIQQ